MIPAALDHSLRKWPVCSLHHGQMLLIVVSLSAGRKMSVEDNNTEAELDLKMPDVTWNRVKPS